MTMEEDFLANLQQEYILTIESKVNLLEKLIRNIQSNPTLENIQALKREIHKIAGSAGTYGFAEVSELCRTKDLEASDLLAKRDLQKIKEWANTLLPFLDKVKSAFKSFSPTSLNIRDD